jgi:hypothetical protein
MPWHLATPHRFCDLQVWTESDKKRRGRAEYTRLAREADDQRDLTRRRSRPRFGRGWCGNHAFDEPVAHSLSDGEPRAGTPGDRHNRADRRGRASPHPPNLRDFTTQGGGPGWHHYHVLGLASLFAGSVPGVVRGLSRYRREATRRCGTVALRSWVVFLQFPEAPMASTSFAHMLVARTPRGWVAW